VNKTGTFVAKNIMTDLLEALSFEPENPVAL
jgi:hypothetical protein